MLYIAGSVLLSVLNVVGMWLLAGRHRGAWLFLIILQALWVPYDVVTHQYGFLLPGLATGWVCWRGWRGGV